MAAAKRRLRTPPQSPVTAAAPVARAGRHMPALGYALTIVLAGLPALVSANPSAAQQSSPQTARPTPEIPPDVAERIKVHIPSVILAEPARETALAIFITMRDQIPNNSLLRIRGLPATATLSEGHAIAPGTWAVPLAAVPRLRVSLPADVSGKSEVTIVLVTVDGHVLAEAKSALVVGTTARLIAPDLPQIPPTERPSTAVTSAPPPALTPPPPSVSPSPPIELPATPPKVVTIPATPPPSPPAVVAAPQPLEPPAVAPKVAAVHPPPPPPAVVAAPQPPEPPAAAPKVAAVPPPPPPEITPAAPAAVPKSTVAAIPPSAVTPPPATKPPPLSAEARGRAMVFVTRGTVLLDEGNIAGARNFFERAADAGLPEGAAALGMTYDPHELARLKVHGLRPDVAAARRWYEKARDMGSTQAAENLARLGF